MPPSPRAAHQAQRHRGEVAPCCGLSRSRPTPHKKSHHLQTIPEASQEKHQDRPAPSSRAISIPDGRFRFFSLAWRRWLPRNALTSPGLPLRERPMVQCAVGRGTARGATARHANQAAQKQIAQISQIARLAGVVKRRRNRTARPSLEGERLGDGDGERTRAVWLSKVARQSKRGHATGSLTPLACQIGDPFILPLPFLSFSPCGLWLGPWVPCMLSGQGCLVLGDTVLGSAGEAKKGTAYFIWQSAVAQGRIESTARGEPAPGVISPST